VQETGNIAGTRVATLIEELDRIYAEIGRTQSAWREATPFGCPDGCGLCCVDFEPDVLECEALYLAAWMLFHQRERAEAILSGSFASPRPDSERGCFLFDPDSPYHCTVYGGRCLICRLFGYSGDRGKDGLPRWKPCKHLPSEAHGQYGFDELVARFGVAPPAMGDSTAQVSGLMPGSSGDRKPLREALPLALANLVMLERLSLA
jgi:Fe-S-cluster containining protein